MKTVVHKEKVNINFKELCRIEEALRQEVLPLVKGTSEYRSAFCKYNVISKFRERVHLGTDFVSVGVEGCSDGKSARVYYTPSLTSMSKPFRYSVEAREGYTFLFFDFKAAEFFLNCLFAGQEDAVESYHRGEDIYENFKSIFPPNISRDAIKRILIGNLYNVTPYTVSKVARISEYQAEMLLKKIEIQIPKMTELKNKIISYSKRRGGDYCPNGLDMKHMILVNEFSESNPQNIDRSLSVFTQSALGLFVQSKIKEFKTHDCVGTILTVFDSFLIEVKNEEVSNFKEIIHKSIYPFRADGIGEGKTFGEAAYGDKYKV